MSAFASRFGLLGALGVAALGALAGSVGCSSNSADGGDESNAAIGGAGPCSVTDAQKGGVASLAGDDSPFARLVLANPKVAACPTTFTAVLATLDKVVPHPERRLVFAVDETGTQPDAGGHRFVVSQDTGDAPVVGNGTGAAGDNTTRVWLAALEDSADASKPHGLAEDFIEVIAFSASRQANVFYKFFDGQWHLMGDGTQANPATSSSDEKFFCRNCHATGALNFKELELPWNNWNSARFAMPKPTHMTGTMKDLFSKVGDAYVLEKMIERSNDDLVTGRVTAVLAGKRKGESFKTLLREVMCDVGEPKLASTQAATKKAALDNDGGKSILLRSGTFAVSILPTLTSHDRSVAIDRTLYTSAVAAAGQTVDGKAGDTLFALFMPERSFVDQAVAQALVTAKVLDQDTLVDILMTDFPNPVFSAQRCALAETIPDGVKNVATLRAAWAPVLTASGKTGALGLAKRLANTKDADAHTQTVDDYFKACEARGASATEAPKLMSEVLRIASQRRLAFETDFPKINEAPALIPKDKLGPVPNGLHMHPDCTVSTSEADIAE